MALNLKTLGIRSVSAAIFVVLLLGSVYWSYWGFCFFFAIVALLALREYFQILKATGNDVLQLTGFISAVIMILCFIDFNVLLGHSVVKIPRTVLFLVPVLILCEALFSKVDRSIQAALITLGGLTYCVLPFALLMDSVLMRNNAEPFTPMLIIGIIFLIWINDTFAYLGGSMVGKRKMYPRVSPGKTWEGTIIGVVIAFCASFLFNSFIYELPKGWWQIMGFAVPVLSTIGDLIESRLKREAGVKDSGAIMPGHGGVLDRFDSLIFVAPFAYVFFNVIY